VKILQALKDLVTKGVTKKQAVDAAKRAGHTFWQAFTAVIGVTWAASGLDVHQVVSVASGERFAIAALAAVGAAALSALKTTLLAVMNDPVDYIGQHEASATGPPPSTRVVGGSSNDPGWTAPPPAGQ